MRGPSHWRLTLVAVLVLLGACASDDGPERSADLSTTEAARSETTTPLIAGSAPDSAPVAPIEWEPCGGEECATVVVPLDHDDPDGPTIDLAVRRRPATGDRIGALFFNFGGPGSPATSLLGSFPVPGAVHERFDLVAVDPRGVGGSTPLDCGLPPRELYSVDPTVERAADARALIDVSERYAADCAAERGDYLAHVGTRDVARDLDLVRAAMGDEKLNFIGFSYGTAIGQAYAELFPRRIRTMVLDGIIDTAAGGVARAVEQAKGFETALAHWAAGCRERSSCSFADPIGAVESMLQAAERGVPSRSGRDLGPGEAAVGLALPLYSQSLWPHLDQAIAAAVDGDGTEMVALAERYEGLVDFSVYFAVSCLDIAWPDTPEVLLDRAEDAGRVAPHFGEALLNDYLRCTVWPVPSDPLGAISAPDAPPILVVSTTGDPATPYEDGVVVANRLERGILLTNEGEGHTITFQGSPCVDRVVIDYLIDRVEPAEGDRC